MITQPGPLKSTYDLVPFIALRAVSSGKPVMFAAVKVAGAVVRLHPPGCRPRR